MRVVAVALVALTLGIAIDLAMPDFAFAQSRGPDYPDDRSGPPRYYTDQPPRGAAPDFDQPQVRSVPDDQRDGFEPASTPRQRPWPPSYGPNDRRPEPPYRRVDRAPPRSNYQRFWDDGDGRGRTVTKPAPRDTVRREALPREAAPREAVPPSSRVVQEPRGGPVSRVAVGTGQMVISISEYQSLQDQARQLQRLLGTRRDFHDDRSSRDFRDDGPRRDTGPREIYR
jgi:hypothetical protein